MSQNVVFRVKHEIKMQQNSKIIKKPAKLKCCENFLP